MDKFIFLLLMLLSFSVWSFDANNCEFSFSPNGGATAASVALIDSAKDNILVDTYKMTSEPIASALVRAKTRGVPVQVIVDKSQPNGLGSQLPMLTKAGIPVYIDSAHAIQHNKVIVVDNFRFQTGSFNFSAAAEKSNAENVLICNSPVGSNELSKDWNKHRLHSTKY